MPSFEKNYKGNEKRDNTPSVLENPRVKKFLEQRDINPSHFFIVEQLAEFSKNLLIEELHNLFNLSHEGSGQSLERRIAQIDKALEEGKKDIVYDFETRRNMLELTLNFYEEYGWIASYALVRVLEDIDSSTKQQVI